MKTKMMKRAAAFAASVLMTAAMAVPVFAADTNVLYTSPIFTDDKTSNDNIIVVPKKLYLFNVDGAQIYVPDVTYTYTVTPTNGGQKISSKAITRNESGDYTPDNDKDAFTLTQAGPADAILLGTSATAFTNQEATISFADKGTKKAASNESTEIASAKSVETALYIKADSSKFEKPGVYRYKIELTGETRAAVGVEDWNHKLKEKDTDEDAGTYYLDVYVSEIPDNNSTTGGTMKDVYGMVLSKVGDVPFTYDSTAADDAKKINTLEPDEYHTYNLQIEKEITGTMADKTQDFTFAVTLNNTTAGGTNFEFTTTGSKLSPAASPQAFASGTIVSADLSDGETLSIVGLPINTKATINEKNLSNDSYTVSVNTANTEKTNNSASGDTYQFTGKNDSHDVVSAYNISLEAKGDKILINNNLDAISPTGVLFRIAPYALMMTAGGVLIAVYLRGKKRDDAESMI